jgi:tetratricopeptide (TPR) repeat protein
VTFESGPKPSAESQQAFLLALGQHRDGNLDGAEAHYRAVLKAAPAHAGALHMLGVLLDQKGDPRAALGLIQEAIERAAHSREALPDAYYNKGNVLSHLGMDEAAVAAYDRALMQDPASVDTFVNRGNALRRLNRLHEALASYDRALILRPDYAPVYVSRSDVLRALGEPQAALESCDRAFTLNLRSAELYLAQANALFDLQRHVEALASYETVLRLQPDSSIALTGATRAALIVGESDLPRAEAAFARLTHAYPQSASLHNEVGVFLVLRNRFEPAREMLTRAAAIRPDWADPFHNLGWLAQILGRPQESEAHFRRALALQPDRVDTQWNLGMTLLSLGRYAEGWSLYDLRDDPSGVVLPTVPFPRWQGQPLLGKSLLIWNEQGFGDEIQFCRYVPILKDLGARHITLVCKRPLSSLLKGIRGVDAICAREDIGSLGAHDYWTLLMSIPRHCRTTLETIPAQLPYLSPPRERIEKWSARLPAGGLRVGLAWKGSQGNKRDTFRSLPALSTLAPLWRTGREDVRFFSLQMGNGQEECARSQAEQPLVDLGRDITDFADTAAIVASLDLVIAVDTAVVHLAGALNRPCWIMLPCIQTDWRWLYARSDSPWYPKAVRLFRQRQPSDWSSVVSEMATELKGFAGGR